MSGFVFNGQSIDDEGDYAGYEAYGTDDGGDGEYSDEEDEDDTYDADAYGEPDLHSLPRMNSAGKVELGNNGARHDAAPASKSFEEMDKMLSRPPPKLSHFVSDDLPALTEERRRLRLAQYSAPASTSRRSPVAARSKTSPSSRSNRGQEFDTGLLNEAFAYVKKLTGTVNADALSRAGGGGKKKKKSNGVVQGSAVRAARANGRGGARKGKKKGTGPRKLNTHYGKGKSKVGGSKFGLKLKKAMSMNERVKERLHEEAFKKSGENGPSVDMQALIAQFETGSELAKLRSELAKAKESETSSTSFIEAARRDWLQ